MFRCVPCLHNRAILEELKLHAEEDPRIRAETEAETTDVMKEATKKLKKKRREKKRLMAAGERDLLVSEQRGEEDEWVAEVERGILLTLVSEPGGGNRMEKIHFREDLFDASEARQWWNENCEKVLDLYSIHLPPNPKSFPSNQESKQKSKENKSDLPYTEYLSIGSTSTSMAQPRKGEEKRVVVPGRLVECVVEDHPGVFVTVRRLPDGKQELRKVEIRGEKFGEVKARVWWEENKARLHTQYTRPA